MTDTPTYEQLSALCAQMAAALAECRDALNDMAHGRGTLRPIEFIALEATGTIAAYRTLSPDPVYAAAEKMREGLERIASSETKIDRCNIARRALIDAGIASWLNRARGEG